MDTACLLLTSAKPHRWSVALLGILLVHMSTTSLKDSLDAFTRVLASSTKNTSKRSLLDKLARFSILCAKFLSLMTLPGSYFKNSVLGRFEDTQY